MQIGKKLVIGGVALALAAAAAVPLSTASTRNGPERVLNNRLGNVIFIHPDGTGANHWAAGRMYWDGPDANSQWDQLAEMAVYRGHMTDLLTGTSNGGATTHAFGYKVAGPGSFGQDGERPILALSGFAGSILREAGNQGHPVGVVNDGDMAEPGTGAFLAEVAGRGESEEIVRQMLEGRPGKTDSDPVVMMAGGERFFLPVGTPACTSAVTPDCAVHFDPVEAASNPTTPGAGGPTRTDGRNLIQEAIADGWTVVRTRAEFEALKGQLASDPNFTPKVLGLFGADDIFNDVPEERLIALGLRDTTRDANSKEGNLLLFGSMPGTLGYNPPTAAEMTEAALTILDRHSRKANKSFMVVTEVESTDNFGNNDNAIGTLVGLNHANGVIGAARSYLSRSPRTLIVTAADSDAGAMSVVSLGDATRPVGTINVNPTGVSTQNFNVALDGREGRASAPFLAAPDAYGKQLPFAVAWMGTPDVGGGIISRADGQNAALLRTIFAQRFDNTDVYRLMYLTLFGRVLPPSVGQVAPGR
ncbi:MAG: alkaline phosphatase [Chloroflexaceae bacterium]|jgi:alkaline phosphatase|nr:alkaline phosphatase [Chloroflexaceae bacterium]